MASGDTPTIVFGVIASFLALVTILQACFKGRQSRGRHPAAGSKTDGMTLTHSISEPDLEAHRLWYGQTRSRRLNLDGRSPLLMRSVRLSMLPLMAPARRSWWPRGVQELQREASREGSGRVLLSDATVRW